MTRFAPGGVLPGLAAVAVLLSGCGAPAQVPATPRPPAAPRPAGVASDRQSPTDYGRLVLADGDRVRVSGRAVSVPHRPVRLCAPVAEGGPGYVPGHEPAPVYCALGVDVTGLDLQRLSRRRSQDGAVEGYTDVEAIYHAGGDGGISVTRQHPYRPDPGPGFVADEPPCPAPPGGWPVGGTDANLDHTAAEAYEAAHPGSILMPAVLRPSRRQVLAYALTAGDPAPVEAALRPAYGPALCVVRSRYSRAQIDRAATAFDPEAPALRDAGLLVLGSGGLARDEQAVVDVSLVRVTPQVAALAARQPAGLVRLHPWLYPASLPDGLVTTM